MKQRLLVVFVFMMSQLASGASPEAEKEVDPFDGLGANRDLYEQISQNTKGKIQIVQRRYNDRTLNAEFSMGYGAVMSGQNYLNSQVLQASMDFHITPRWSVAVRGRSFSNQLNSEGEQVFNAADGALNAPTGGQNVSRFEPVLNPRETQIEGLARWYPLYGKFSVLNRKVVHFDFYTQLGASTITFRDGSEVGFLGGVGVATWLGPHWTARLEFNVENFTQNLGAQSDTVNPTELNFSVGYLL